MPALMEISVATVLSGRLSLSAGIDQQEGPDHTSACGADDNACDHQPVLAWIFVVEDFEFIKHEAGDERVRD